jgi:hypothetical protein
MRGAWAYLFNLTSSNSMQALKKRITVLEQSIPTTNTEPVFIHLVALGGANAQIERITKGNKEWLGQPNESEQELKDRAISEVIQPLAGCSTVFLCY